MEDTGGLKGSITYEVSNGSVAVGSNKGYADKHQRGGPVSSAPITKAVQGLIKDWLRGAGKPWAPVFRKYTKPKWTGKSIQGSVPARPFVGLTDQTREDINELLGAHLMEAE